MKKMTLIESFIIDAIDPKAYARVHFDPSTLEKKIRGYRTLLEAGFSPEKTWACICLTQPSVEVIEETVDWFLDLMGAGFVNYIPFKNVGFASSQGMEAVQRAPCHGAWDRCWSTGRSHDEIGSRILKEGEVNHGQEEGEGGFPGLQEGIHQRAGDWVGGDIHYRNLPGEGRSRSSLPGRAA